MNTAEAQALADEMKRHRSVIASKCGRAACEDNQLCQGVCPEPDVEQ